MDDFEAIRTVGNRIAETSNPYSIIDQFDAWFAFAVKRAELIATQPRIGSWMRFAKRMALQRIYCSGTTA